MTASTATTFDIPAAEREATLQRVRTFARVMDSYLHLPGGYRVGVEGIIGLVPVVGDFAGSILSLYIPFEAYRLNVPESIIMKMFGNIVIDAVVGALPVLGDLFDIAWKANLRNLRLLEDYLAHG